MAIRSQQVKELAAECGFELAGITRAEPLADFSRFDAWRQDGMAGEMTYLTDRRGDLRADPRHLLAGARSIICVGKLYNSQPPGLQTGEISRYAWGTADYHDVLRDGLKDLAQRIGSIVEGPFEWRACVDTAPLLERSYAQAAGLGWIGKNTCLINQKSGSWFFLGELLVSLELDSDEPAPFRCGSCTRCIEACPTDAIVPGRAGGWQVDSNLCISYLTIEKRGFIDAASAATMGTHLFGCDICQDVCPWNRRAPITEDERFARQQQIHEPTGWAELTREEFRDLFRRSPVWRAKYEGFLRNVAIALANGGGGNAGFAQLAKLAEHPDYAVASAARNGLQKLREERALSKTEESS